MRVTILSTRKSQGREDRYDNGKREKKRGSAENGGEGVINLERRIDG